MAQAFAAEAVPAEWILLICVFVLPVRGRPLVPRYHRSRRKPLLQQELISKQNSPDDEEATEEDEALEDGESPFVPDGQPSDPSLQPPEEPLHAASSPPIGLPMEGRAPSPSADPSAGRPQSPATASSAASPPTTLGRVRARPLPPFFTRKPPSTSSNWRRSCAFPGPTAPFLEALPDSLKRPFCPFPFLCPSIPIPSPLFRLHERGIDGHLLHPHLPHRIPPPRRAWRICCQIPFS